MRASDPFQAFHAAKLRPQLVLPSDLPRIWEAAFPHPARRPPLSLPEVEGWEIPAEESRVLERSPEFRRFMIARGEALKLENTPRPDLVGASDAKKQVALRKIEAARLKALKAHSAFMRVRRATEIRHRPAGELNDALLRWIGALGLSAAPTRDEQLKALQELRAATDALMARLSSSTIEHIFGDRFGHHYLFGRIEAQLGSDIHGGLTATLEHARGLILYDERIRTHLAQISAAASHWQDRVSKEAGKRGPRRLVARHEFVLAVTDVFEVLAARRAAVTRAVGSADEGRRGGAAARFLAAVCEKAELRLSSFESAAAHSALAELAKASAANAFGGWVEEALKNRIDERAAAASKQRRIKSLPAKRQSSSGN